MILEMARNSSSQKLPEMNGENVRPISVANTGHGSNCKEEVLKDIPNSGSAQTMNPSKKESSTHGEGSAPSPNETDGMNGCDSEPSNDTRTNKTVVGEENNADEEEAEPKDEIDGNVVTRFFREFIEGHDDEIKTYKVQLYSCNQSPEIKGGFLRMEVVDNDRLQVTTTGFREDPQTIWLTHYTLNEDLNQLVIFENESCSRKTRAKCVLFTQHVGDSEEYILTGKKVNTIPVRLREFDPEIGFVKKPKAVGSELLVLKSMLTSKERPLMVGFDGAGQPIPLNKVQKYSADFQAFFRILEAR
ncbi:uncharacterized protein LOC114525780 [Dendronephthya gigantea]|uniref:uncharacterized protein LOC114525780 n=1 Tax=Dendronephthya gigantea TaxID=151771 RepID=UPI00106A7496|nr:uncharacterized protein LOC114525780 [Dendronephthya gigantea]